MVLIAFVPLQLLDLVDHLNGFLLERAIFLGYFLEVAL